MKVFKYILTCSFILFTCCLLAQDAEPAVYAVLVKKAQEQYRAKDYKASGLSYSSAFGAFGGKGHIDDRYDAACSWAQAGNADSAFFNLHRIATKAAYADSRRLMADEDLVSLHKDSRWVPLLALVSTNKDKAEAGYNRPLLYLLDSLERKDQVWRNFFTRFSNSELRKEEDTLSREEIVRRMTVADSINYIVLQDIFNKYGFPNYDLVGQRGSSDFWLLVQHQDDHPDFQQRVLDKMKVEVDAKKASAINYAYLVDRVKGNTGQPQVYGSQMRLNADKTSYEPNPVIEPEKLNERRAAMGMGTIESYIELMNTRYRGTLTGR